MIATQKIDRNVLAEALATSSMTQGGWLKALRDELDNDPEGLGYAGKTANDVCALLNATYTVVIPGNQTEKDAEKIDARDFKSLRLEIALELAAIKDDAVRQKGSFIFTQVIEALSQFDTVDLTNPKIVAQFNDLMSLGVLTSEIYDRYFKVVEGGPDQTVEKEARSSVLFGPHIFVEAADIVAARAL